jgi:hypothetical protein
MDDLKTFNMNDNLLCVTVMTLQSCNHAYISIENTKTVLFILPCCVDLYFFSYTRYALACAKISVLETLYMAVPLVFSPEN